MAGNVILPSALPDSYEKRVRWWSVYNTTGETIPPYAVCQLQRKQHQTIGDTARRTAVDMFCCQEERGGSVIWFAQQCNSAGESRQNSAEFVFNGPLPIPPRKIGRGTFDCPAQVLHNGSDSLINGGRCGPVAGAWYVSSAGSAFTCVSHDDCSPVGTGQIHTVWLTTGTGQHGYHAVGSGVLQATFADNEYVRPAVESLDSGVSVGDKGLVVAKAGVYVFGFQATLSSTTALASHPLTLAVWKIPDGEAAEATLFYAQRYNAIELDGDGLESSRNRENVAATGLVNMGAGDELYVKNTTATYAVTVANFQFWLAKIAPYVDDSVSDDGLSFDS